MNFIFLLQGEGKRIEEIDVNASTIMRHLNIAAKSEIHVLARYCAENIARQNKKIAPLDVIAYIAGHDAKKAKNL